MATSATGSHFAKSGTATSRGRPRDFLRSNLKIIDKARELYPVKTALQLAEITGYPLRTVEYWLQGTHKIPTDAFIALLHSDQGREFLAGVMTDATPRWWLQLKAFFNAIDLAVAQRIHRRKMKALLNGDFSKQIPYASLFQDEEFYGAQPSPAHGVDSAVVRRKSR